MLSTVSIHQLASPGNPAFFIVASPAPISLFLSNFLALFLSFSLSLWISIPSVSPEVTKAKARARKEGTKEREREAGRKASLTFFLSSSPFVSRAPAAFAARAAIAFADWPCKQLRFAQKAKELQYYQTPWDTIRTREGFEDTLECGLCLWD